MQKNDTSHLALRSVDTTYKIITRGQKQFFFDLMLKKIVCVWGGVGIFFRNVNRQGGVQTD